MGDLVGAVDRYADIPAPVRARLKQRVAKRDYDDLVSIRRDSIRGKHEYGATISDMHFGTHQVCRSVTRAEWSPKMEERGLVYCEQEHCILIPTVCRNVSRIARAGGGAAPATAAGAPTGDAGLAAAAAPTPSGDALPPTDAFDPAAASTLVAAGPAPLAFGTSGGNVADSSSFAAGSGLGFGLPSAGVTAPWSSGTSHKIPPSSNPGDPNDPGDLLGGAPPAGQAPDNAALVSPVPEPQTWALMLGGLALLVWRGRKPAA